jgi:hypothetical protein
MIKCSIVIKSDHGVQANMHFSQLHNLMGQILLVRTGSSIPAITLRLWRLGESNIPLNPVYAYHIWHYFMSVMFMLCVVFARRIGMHKCLK